MVMKRKALGRGLNALLPSPEIGESEKVFLEIPIGEILPNPYQPRTSFDPELLEELALSIKSNGVVQPVIVRRAGQQYQLVTGERRWRAAILAGLKRIPAVVRDVSEYKTLELALIENIQRADLNPIEEASAYASLMEDFQLTQEEIAQRVGKDRTSIANYLRLLKLPAEVRAKIQNQELTMGHARALISLKSAKEQLELANKIIDESLNVRQAELLTRNRKVGNTKLRDKLEATADPNVRSAEQKLQEHFGTRVLIRGLGKERGRIEIYYENSEDLIRLYDLMIREGDRQ